MKLSRIMIPLTLLICAGGCHPTPYQKAYRASAHGYSDKQLSEDTFYVQFVGNPLTSSGTLHQYLFRSAAHLTLQHGFRYFTVVRGPCSRMAYRTAYRATEDLMARVDGVEMEVPTWGTLQMTVQCFQDMPRSSDTGVIDAKAYVSPYALIPFAASFP